MYKVYAKRFSYGISQSEPDLYFLGEVKPIKGVNAAENLKSEINRRWGLAMSNVVLIRGKHIRQIEAVQETVTRTVKVEETVTSFRFK